MAEGDDINNIEMSELEKTYFKLTFLRDDFSQQIKVLAEHNENLHKNIKGFVSHIDEIDKAPDRVKEKVDQHLTHLLNQVAEKTAHSLVEQTQQDIKQAMQELSDTVLKTSQSLAEARTYLNINTLWWHLGMGGGSVMAAVIVFFTLHFFVFPQRIPTLSLTDDVHARLALGDHFDKFLKKLSPKQKRAVSDILFDVKKPTDIFNKEYKE